MAALRAVAALIEKYIVVFVVLGLIGLFAVGFQVHGVQEAQRASLNGQTRNRVSNVLTWCDSINEGRDYNRGFATQTLKQSESEVKVIYAALKGHSSLTVRQVSFLRLYLDSVIALEKAAPKTLSLHPYTLRDLPCRTLASRTAASTRH